MNDKIEKFIDDKIEHIEDDIQKIQVKPKKYWAVVQ